jgi:PAS domain S-box-containing protein
VKYTFEDMQKVTVLYVEDENEIRQNTATILGKLFKKVYIAEDGELGLDLFKKYKDEIDIVVSDINMPQKSGLKMSEEIKSCCQVPIILTTAFTDKEYLLKSIEVDIDEYITKPFKVKDLTEKIVDLGLKFQQMKQRNSTTAVILTNAKKDKEKKVKLEEEVKNINQELTLLRTLTGNYICSIKTDKMGIVKEVSNKFTKLYGYTQKEIIGQNINIILETNTNEIQRYMLDAIYEKKAINSIHNFKTKNGNILECDMVMMPSFAEDGYINGYTFYQDLIHI